MANRALDWLSQAEHDLDHARNASEDGDFDWACFAAHQAAEKAVKALFLHLGGEAWGHGLLAIVKDLGQRIATPPEMPDRARRLDKHYIPTRYPNGFEAGAPHQYYTAGEAQEAISDAEEMLRFSAKLIRRDIDG